MHAGLTTCFVVPPLDGPPTGGTLYNARLLAAITAAGVRVRVGGVEQALAEPPTDGIAWIDTLFLEQTPAIARTLPQTVRPGLLVHYLPTLVDRGLAGLDALTPHEQQALASAEVFATSSGYMADVLVRVGVASGRVAVVEPGYSPPPSHPSRSNEHVRVVVVANLVKGKGVAELLRAFGRHGAHDGLHIAVIGGRPDLAYAKECEAAASAAVAAGIDVELVGPVPPSRCLERIAAADVLASASCMESFGMAIADARACGVPVVARRGGNVVNLVGEESGGQIVDDEAAVAQACVQLVRDPVELGRRRARAQACRIRRSWSDAARDFMAALVSLAPGE